MHFPASSLLLSLGLAASTFACTGQIGDPISDEDGLFDEENSDTPRPDDLRPGEEEESDENIERCGVPSAVSDLGMRTGIAYKDSENGDDMVEANLIVREGPPDDILWLGLFEGYGAFKNDAPEPGTYNIAGDDASAADCGACIILDINATADSAERSMIAVSGQLTIGSLSGAVSGSAQNLVLQEIDPQTGATVPGGCSTSIENIDFSAPIQ